jgi:uncharacterized membrane protein YhaH (DUF805 family)
VSWYLAVLKNYVGFSGRARRKEYWMFTLVNVVVLVVLEILAAATKSSAFTILYVLYALAVLLPSIAVIMRRLHDTGRSGGWVFIVLVPFIGSIWLLVLTCLEGTRGDNQYGPDPKVEQAPAMA